MVIYILGNIKLSIPPKNRLNSIIYLSILAILPSQLSLSYYLWIKRIPMITNFEKQTASLNEYEMNVLLPIMVKCLSKHIGKDRVISNSEMCLKMAEFGYQICDARVRKIINHIRINSLVECLIATGKGYYVAQDESEMKTYISSVKSREEAIQAMRMAMEEQLERMMNKKPTETILDGLQSSPLPLS